MNSNKNYAVGSELRAAYNLNVNLDSHTNTMTKESKNRMHQDCKYNGWSVFRVSGTLSVKSRRINDLKDKKYYKAIFKDIKKLVREYSPNTYLDELYILDSITARYPVRNCFAKKVLKDVVQGGTVAKTVKSNIDVIRVKKKISIFSLK